MTCALIPAIERKRCELVEVQVEETLWEMLACCCMPTLVFDGSEYVEES
jgi:hypothetical protein